MCWRLALIRDQQYSNKRVIQYLGQLLQTWDCPGDYATVGAYVLRAILNSHAHNISYSLASL